LISLVRRIISCVDATAKVFDDMETEEVFLFGIDQIKASMSSKIMDWIRWCILLCGVVWFNR
jgi:hypothetical protein